MVSEPSRLILSLCNLPPFWYQSQVVGQVINRAKLRSVVSYYFHYNKLVGTAAIVIQKILAYFWHYNSFELFYGYIPHSPYFVLHLFHDNFSISNYLFLRLLLLHHLLLYLYYLCKYEYINFYVYQQKNLNPHIL